MRVFEKLWSPEGGAGAGGGGAGAGAGGADAGAGGAGAGAGGAPAAPGAVGNLGAAAPLPGAWKLPDGVPDHLKGDTPDAFASKVFEDWGKQRQALSKFEIPAKAEDYAYTPSDKVKDFVGDLARDPVYNAAREAALKAGVPKAAFTGLVGGLYEQLVDKGLVPKPYNPVTERAAFFGDEARGLNDQQLVEKLAPMLNGAQGWINSLASDKTLDQAQAAQLMSLLDTASGARAVLALQAKFAPAAGPKAPGPGDSSAAGETADTLRKAQADPRADPNRQEYDPKYAQEITARYQKFYGAK